MTYPLHLVSVLLLGHLLSNAIRVAHGPLGKLLKNCDLTAVCEQPTFVNMSKSVNFAGSSSVPKGLRSGALATYCLRVYSSKISELYEVSGVRILEGNTNVRPRWDETNFSSARPISGRTVELLFRHSISIS
jgi:hypothetical protein